MLELLPAATDSEIPPRPPREALAAELTSLWAQTDGLGPDLWADAGMPELVRYLLGAKDLHVYMSEPRAAEPVLRGGWSASSLLSGIRAMDQDCLNAIKRELPDDPKELQQLQEANANPGDHAEAPPVAGTTQPDSKAPEAEEPYTNGEEPAVLHVATLTRYEKEKGPHREDQEVVNCKAACEASWCLHKQWYISLAVVQYDFPKSCSGRLCEYDEDTLEYWVNVRTSGTLSREDLLTLSKSRTHEQETTADTFASEHVDLGVGGFAADLGSADPALATEGDKSLGAPAADCVEEAKSASVKDDCPVLRQIARARVTDPDEPLFKALRDSGHALDVPITTLKLDNTFEYPCLHPRDLLFAFANEGCTQKIFGVEGPLETVEKSLADFWRRFRLANPTHDLSQLGEGDQNWSRLLPFYLHGDGGRTYKKDPFLVLSMYNALGRGTAKRRASTQLGRHAKRKHEDDSSAEDGIECGVNLIGPLLAYLPVDQEDLASFYKPDLFHILHAGVGKDFAASCILYFCAKTFKASKIALALDHVNYLFRNFLAREKERVNFSNFTFELLGYESTRTYPVGPWSKNLDTAVVIKFVEHVAANHLDPEDPIMQLIVQGSGAINHFMRVLFSAPYWLSESEAWQAIFAGQEFLSTFAGLAQACYDQKLCLFKLKPKLHMFAHIVLRMLQQFRCGNGCTTNPVAEATFMSEDFVGHVSRLSRRVNARRHGHKIYNRYCVAVCQKLRAGDAVKKSQRKYVRDQGLV
eukprot:s3790_g7.t1